MLVLTRKQNEKICIGDSITITVLRMKGKAVRLGIEAPAEIGVMRGELVFDLETEEPAEEAAQPKKKTKHSASTTSPRENGWPVSSSNTGSAPLRAMMNSPLLKSTLLKS